MKRNGFTMVELIFVIIIIGILSVAAIPKFGDIKDRAKINSELSAMESLSAAMTVAQEARMDDYDDSKVNWHNLSEADANGTNGTDAASVGSIYKQVNDSGTVLSKIAAKTGKLKITGFAPMYENGSLWGYTDGIYYTPLVITGEASSIRGVPYPKEAPGEDISGKPDKNDFWIFNPSSQDLTISGTNVNTKIVYSGSIALIDVNGTSRVTPKFKGNANHMDTVYNFYTTGL